jgi:hypothetical protein
MNPLLVVSAFVGLIWLLKSDSPAAKGVGRILGAIGGDVPHPAPGGGGGGDDRAQLGDAITNFYGQPGGTGFPFFGGGPELRDGAKSLLSAVTPSCPEKPGGCCGGCSGGGGGGKGEACDGCERAGKFSDGRSKLATAARGGGMYTVPLTAAPTCRKSAGTGTTGTVSPTVGGGALPADTYYPARAAVPTTAQSDAYHYYDAYVRSIIGAEGATITEGFTDEAAGFGLAASQLVTLNGNYYDYVRSGAPLDNAANAQQLREAQAAAAAINAGAYSGGGF